MEPSQHNDSETRARRGPPRMKLRQILQASFYPGRVDSPNQVFQEKSALSSTTEQRVSGYNTASPNTTSGGKGRSAASIELTELVFWAPITVVLLAALLRLAFRPPLILDNSVNGFACDKTGQVRPLVQPNATIWDVQYTFTVGIGFHGLSFSIAKLLDVCWDLVVGRVGQILVTVMLYRILRPATVLMLRNGGLRHEQVLAMQYSPASFWTFRSCVRDILGRSTTSDCFGPIEEHNGRALRPVKALKTFRRLYRTVLVFATMYLLAFPTWLSAMTAYQNPNMPVFQVEVGSIVTFDKLQTCAGVVVDGSRVGLADNACINSGTALYPAVLRYLSHLPHTEGIIEGHYHTRVGSYFVFFDDIPTNFTYRGHTSHLDGPSLTIKMSATKWSLGGRQPFWSYANQAYNVTQLQEKTICQTQQTYQWGFSFLLLFSFVVVSLVLACLVCALMYTSWRLDHVERGRLQTPPHREHEGRIFGSVSTAVEVTASIQGQLGTGKVEGFTNSDMCKALKDNKARMRSATAVDQVEQVDEG